MMNDLHFNELSNGRSIKPSPVRRCGSFVAFLFASVLFFGCSSRPKAAPDCNCSPQKALIDEVSIHTLQTARFSKTQLMEYMHGKCLNIDSAVGGNMENFRFYPVLICGIPGTLTFGEFLATTKLTPKEIEGASVEFGPIKDYGYTTNLSFIDSTNKKVGITLPASITTNEALRVTFGHRIHTFGGPDNDSIALYWHGIFFEKLFGGGVDILINDSTKWAEDILLRDDKRTGPN